MGMLKERMEARRHSKLYYSTKKVRATWCLRRLHCAEYDRCRAITCRAGAPPQQALLLDQDGAWNLLSKAF